MPTMGRDPNDRLVFWQTNEITLAKPPSDRADWVRIIRETAPHRVRVVLTTDGQGRWRVSVAEETRVIIGTGPVPPEPIDHRTKVTEALRKAGKPVRD